MAKYIIDIPRKYEEGDYLHIPISCENSNTVWMPTNIKPIPYAELSQETIESEVLKFVRELIRCNNGKQLSYQEVKAKYEAWKQEKEEIHTGDEVRCMDRVGIVVRIDSMDGGSNVVWEDGATAYIGIKDLTKTGRHFNEVEKLLDKMKGE